MGHINKHGKSWLKKPTNFLLAPLWRPLHSNVWWSEGLELINNGFTYATAHELHHKGIQCVDDNWNIEHHILLSCNEAQNKLKTYRRREKELDHAYSQDR